MTIPYGPTSPALGPWADQLQRATWRGLPFAITEDDLRPGRRIVLHEYPYRNTPYPEDLGLATVTIPVTGFLTGDDLFDQRDAMRTAVDQAGPGEFVHPSLGSMQGVVINPSFLTRPVGRTIEFRFTFIRSGQSAPIYPTATASTQSTAIDAADAADTICASDFVDDVTDAVALGQAVVQSAVATVTGFVATVVGTAEALEQLAAAAIALPGEILTPIIAGVGQIAGIINDAAVMAGAVLGLVAPVGYYFGRYSTMGLTALLSGSATVASQLSSFLASAGVCTGAMASCLSTAATSPLSLPASVQAAVAALVAAIPAPADQLRLLTVLARYQAVPMASSAPIGAAVATMQSATAALVRRAALTALVRAEAVYQPTSFNDAAAVRQSITAVLDAEISIASNDGDTASFAALRAMRAAVVLDLVTRGALLPRLVTVTRNVALPSLTLAWQLYGDASRSDDLIARVDPPHPGFFPVVFDALSY
jgi:prophage DNA circulation protein